MKKLLFILTSLLLIAAGSFGQTLQSGTYSNFSGNQSIVIPTGATVTITGSIALNDQATVTIQQGGTLNLPNGLTTNNLFFINSGGKVNVTGNFEVDRPGSKIEGNLIVSNTYHINSLTTFAGCGVAQATTLYIDNDNVVTGAGLLVATNYDNQGQVGGWSGHPLTQSSNIYINCNTTLNVGATQHTGATSACSVVTPVLLVDVTAKLDAGILTFNWTSTSETTNDKYVVEGSADGKTWVAVGEVKSYWPNGTGSNSHNYSFTFYDLISTEAGIGGTFGVLVLLGLIVGLVKSEKRKVLVTYAGIILIALATFSCHKTNTMKNNSVRYPYFRLKSVDLDGTAHYYQTVFKVS